MSSAAGSLVANAPHLPVHLGAMSEAVRFQVAYYGPGGAGEGEGLRVSGFVGGGGAEVFVGTLSLFVCGCGVSVARGMNGSKDVLNHSFFSLLRRAVRRGNEGRRHYSGEVLVGRRGESDA